jgi:hypothetical protein
MLGAKQKEKKNAICFVVPFDSTSSNDPLILIVVLILGGRGMTLMAVLHCPQQSLTQFVFLYDNSR